MLEDSSFSLAAPTDTVASSMATLIEGHSVDHLLKIAEGVVQKKTKESVVLEQEAEDRIPKFDDEGSYDIARRACLASPHLD